MHWGAVFALVHSKLSRDNQTLKIVTVLNFCTRTLYICYGIPHCGVLTACRFFNLATSVSMTSMITSLTVSPSRQYFRPALLLLITVTNDQNASPTSPAYFNVTQIKFWQRHFRCVSRSATWQHVIQRARCEKSAQSLYAVTLAKTQTYHLLVASPTLYWQCHDATPILPNIIKIWQHLTE